MHKVAFFTKLVLFLKLTLVKIFTNIIIFYFEKFHNYLKVLEDEVTALGYLTIIFSRFFLSIFLKFVVPDIIKEFFFIIEVEIQEGDQFPEYIIHIPYLSNERKVLEKWCKLKGYTELQYVDGSWWAIPPGGFIPICLNSIIKIIK